MRLTLGCPAVFAGIGAAFLLSGCGHKERPEQAPALPVAAVRAHTLSQEVRLATEDVVGTVRPKLSAVIAAKVASTIGQMRVAPGQPVKANELLVQLDAREIQARLDQALAVRAQTRGDMERFTRLLAEKAVTQQEFEAVQARQRVAEAAATEAETMLSYTKITAPFDGVITRKHADVGDLATPGKPLLELEDPLTLRLEADVPEAAMGRFALGTHLPVQIAALTTNLEGTVSEIAPIAAPNSRTYLIKLDLPQNPGLRSGQFGRVAIPVAEVTSLRTPEKAVITRGQMELVFVVTNQQAQLRLVKTGQRSGDQVELVSGVEPGERIVVEGAARLVDGQPVRIEP